MRECHGLGADIGIASMRVGERCLLTCSKDYTYGEAFTGRDVPPDGLITFDITLEGIGDERGALLRNCLGICLFMLAVCAFLWHHNHL